MSTVTVTDDEFSTGMHLLEAGIPMTLLLDLATGPHSHDLYLSENGDVEWVAHYLEEHPRQPLSAG